MKLPNGHLARIDERKLIDYSLSARHDHGKHKAKLFRDLLGIDRSSTATLFETLRKAALHGEAEAGKCDCYGQRYRVDFELQGAQGGFQVRSVWIIRTGEVVPDMVTCYIL